MRRHDKRLIPLLVGVFVATFSFAFLMNYSKTDFADAANLANFKPGNIISDYTMSNYNSMTLEEIQSFLTSKNACSNRDYNYYLTLTRTYPDISWHWENNHFVCLSEERFGDGTVIGEGKTAAQIIYETAQEYKINPQVLIVLIEKESSLITDPIPNNRDYRTMTGFGCPDTAPCDSQYFGFKNQIRKAAWLFREVLDGGWTNYPLGENYIQYNPNASCGGSVVNIENLATSALYRYTPYQPNAGAIAAGTGTAYCGAYGNRNFYIYFNDWFGDPTVNYVKKDIVNGIYNILYSSDQSRAISLENDNVIVKGYKSSNKDQRWVIQKDGDFYKIINTFNNKALSADTSSIKNKTNVQTKNTSECSQKWKFVERNNNIYIRSACDDVFVIDLQDGNKNVQLYTQSSSGNQHQEWVIRKAEEDYSGVYNISYSEDDRKVIGYNGNNVEAVPYNVRDSGERWTVKSIDGTNHYTIMNDEGMIIGINNTPANKVNVKTFFAKEGCAQEWIIEKNNKRFFIRSACNPDYVLDLQDGDRNVQIYKQTDYSNPHQEWYLNEVKEDYNGTYSILYSGDIKKTVEQEENGNIVVDIYKKSNDAGWWQFNSIDGTYEYEIINKKTGMALGIIGNVPENKMNIAAAERENTCSQRWKIEKDIDGLLFIQNACADNFVMDLQNGDKNVQIYTQTEYENPHQKWSLRAIKEDFSGTYNILYGSDNKTIISNQNVRTGFYIPKEETQYWEITGVDGYDSYKIVNRTTKKILSLAIDSPENKTNVVEVDHITSCAQRWDIVKDENVFYIMSDCDKNFVLDLQDGDSNVQVYKKTDYKNAHQEWYLRDVEYTVDAMEGVYNIVYSDNIGIGLTVEGDSDGENVFVDTIEDGNKKQQWVIIKNDNQDYYIVNLDTKKALDVKYADFTNKTNIWQYELNETCAQRWVFQKNNDEYIIRNACMNNFVIDLQDGYKNVQIYSETNYYNAHQRWSLKKIDN